MKAVRLLSRSLRASSAQRRSSLSSIRCTERRLLQTSYTSTTRAFTTTRFAYKGLQPDSSDPKTPNTEPHTQPNSSLSAAEISEAEYHELADQYLNTLLLSLEGLAEDASRGVEVEFSAGVLTLTLPGGTYVLNKQPPNKQIWLSSPLSGPKRYDWVTALATQHEKQETEGHQGGVGDDGQQGGGRWIYLRDGSSLTDLLEKETGAIIEHELEGDVTSSRGGPGSGGSAKLDGE